MLKRRRSCPLALAAADSGLLHLVMYTEVMIFRWYVWYVSVNYAELEKCAQSMLQLLDFAEVEKLSFSYS